jgi:hypothetical protein
MIVQRGFTRPPAFFPVAEHATSFPDLYRREQSLLTQPPRHVFDVITNGYGAMYSYADRVAPEDRWRIAAYIRALQISRAARPHDLNDEDRAKLQAASSSTQPSTSEVPNR